MIPPPKDDHDVSAAIDWEDLADLHAGMLSTDDEERLQRLMDQHPELAQRMLADLDAVESEFPDPPGAHAPLHVPPHVAARWQSVIAHEAERRAQGPDPHHQPPLNEEHRTQ